ncbi:MAG: 3-methyladenine DNA glycosylase [Balneolaceae bacterium]|nr:3-methyladenine DNA glycosylase [Balneolaceae bacterium]
MHSQIVEISDLIKTRLSFDEWKSMEAEHQKKVSVLIDEYLDKRSRAIKQPVMDFLFEYYPFRPSWLKKWSPGIAVGLEIADREELPPVNNWQIEDQVAFLTPESIPEKRLKSFKWILHLLKSTQDRRPAFGCFGMHEWAMVYKSEQIRHGQVPLRMESDELAEFVESRPLVCTHFDAFRFFTPDAAPLNKHHLTRQTFADMEQPGCIHSNMDLYKWAFKGFPWISSDTVFAAFQLANEARTVDMKASPYDLREHGIEPIKIETEAGRKEYLEAQQTIFENGIPVREQIIKEYEGILSL